jgi:hypothetical protein
MRIVERAEFLPLPAGTVYKLWQPSSYSGLYIKGDTLHGVDFYETDVIQTLVQGKHEDDYPDTPEDGTTFRADYEEVRNGEFSHDSYCIFDQEDVRQLVGVLLKGG